MVKDKNYRAKETAPVVPKQLDNIKLELEFELSNKKSLRMFGKYIG
jgi:hypothetical protein